MLWEHKYGCCFLIFSSSCPEAYKTSVPRNANMTKLQAGYLFPEVKRYSHLFASLLILFCYLVSDSLGLLTVNQIARRRAAHLLKYPDAEIISLGIGDTTEPIPDVITNAMAEVPSRCEK